MFSHHQPPDRGENQTSVSKMHRLFGTSKRSSMSTLEERRAEELGQHVQAVSGDNERPLLPVHEDRRSADLG